MFRIIHWCKLRTFCRVVYFCRRCEWLSRLSAVCSGSWWTQRRVVFAQIEDPEERAKQEAAKNFVGTAGAPASHAGKPSLDSAADNEEQISDTEEVSGPG